MDDFTKYEQMYASGTDPREMYLVAKDEGLDAITSLRMLRKVCGFSLAEAKRVSGSAEVTSRAQAVEPGRTVYWEGWTTGEGVYLVQARVAEITGGSAILEDHRKFRITPEGLEEIEVEGGVPKSMQVSQLRKPLGERIGELIALVDELSQIRREAV